MRIMLNLFINYSCYYVNQPHDSVLKFSVFMNTIAFRKKKRDREKIGVASQIDWKRKKKQNDYFHCQKKILNILIKMRKLE